MGTVNGNCQRQATCTNNDATGDATHSQASAPAPPLVRRVRKGVEDASLEQHKLQPRERATADPSRRRRRAVPIDGVEGGARAHGGGKACDAAAERGQRERG